MSTPPPFPPRPPREPAPEIRFGGNVQLATLLRAIGDDLTNPGVSNDTARSTAMAHGRTLRALSEALRVPA